MSKSSKNPLEQIVNFPIEKYKYTYQVSNLGYVVSASTDIKLKIYNINSKGPSVRVSNKYFNLASIIAKAFLDYTDKDEETKIICYRDNDINNTKLNNIYIATVTEYLNNTYKSNWKQINQYPEYYVSEDGQIWSKVTKKILQQHINSGLGYYRTCINGKQISIHRLVAEEFIENPNKYDVINHKNGDKKDNKVSNLEWCTVLENNLHSINVLGNKYNGRVYEESPIPENYKKIDWLDNYLFTEEGKVYSLISRRYLSFLNEKDGCYKVEIGGKRYRAHRLIAEAFLEKPSDDHDYVYHLDGDTFNNKPSNLRWVTSNEASLLSNQNNSDRYKSQSKKIAKLDKTTKKVIEIYESIGEAAKKLNLDKGNISKACKDGNKSTGGFKWKYIEKEDNEENEQM
jgi:hypothetical protein